MSVLDTMMPSPNQPDRAQIHAHPPAWTGAGNVSLDQFLGQSVQGGRQTQHLAELIHAIGAGAAKLAGIISLGQIAGPMETAVETADADRDIPKKLDLLANEIFLRAMRLAPVASVVSEELSHPLELHSGAPLAVAIDPLDGSSNIDTNVSMGTIFAIYPAVPGAPSPAHHFLRPGHEQIAAGFVIYGPQTSLVLTMGDGVHVFTLNREAGVFQLAIPRLAIPGESAEYAVNASNYRHWDDSIRAYVDDCMMGAEGPLCRDHNMRWIASLVADAYRILVRGGVFLYPADRRHGYRNGRLRLIYEANPISFLVEQAGGSATSPVGRILEVIPKDLHARTPLVFGSSSTVERIAKYHTDPQFSAERSPLFVQRGLIRR